MEEPLTEDLLSDLMRSDDIECFKENALFDERALSEYLNQLLETKGLKRVDVIREANINNTFGYQVFVGTRRASRDKVLQLAFALHCSLRETNRLLQAAGVNPLYVKVKRDAIIIFAITHGYSLLQANEALYKFGMETLAPDA